MAIRHQVCNSSDRLSESVTRAGIAPEPITFRILDSQWVFGCIRYGFLCASILFSFLFFFFCFLFFCFVGLLLFARPSNDAYWTLLNQLCRTQCHYSAFTHSAWSYLAGHSSCVTCTILHSALHILLSGTLHFIFASTYSRSIYWY